MLDDTRFMDDLNANTLRYLLKHLRGASAKELARLSGVELQAAEQLADKLCASGELLKEGGGEAYYRFNGEYRLVLVICVLEKDRAAAAVSNLYGEYLEEEEISANTGTLDFFDRLVERYLEKYPAIGFLAFAMAGFEVKGRQLLTIDFPKIEVHFRDHFMEKYNLPSILENEIKAAVLGHYQSRNFGEDCCVAALYIAQTHHSGAAACIDGKIYRGRDNAAGEVIFLDTPVRWKHFNPDNDKVDLSRIDIPAFIAEMAVPLIVFLNPHRLVVYGNWLPETTKDEVHNRLLEAIPREFLPELVFVPGILPDVVDGLIHLALKELEPKVDFAAE